MHVCVYIKRSYVKTTLPELMLGPYQGTACTTALSSTCWWMKHQEKERMQEKTTDRCCHKGDSLLWHFTSNSSITMSGNVCVFVLPYLSVRALHTDVLSGDLLPSLRLLHHRLGIHQTKAVKVADCRKVTSHS